MALALIMSACGTPEERAAEHVLAAEQFYASGELAKARAEAQIAIQVAPKNVRARYLLAEVAERNGEIGQMLGHLEVIVGEDRRHVPARIKMASVLLDAEDYEGAASLADAARRLAPTDPAVQLLNARLLLRTGNASLAVQELDAVLARNPGNAEAARLRGVVLAQSDPERGLADLARSAGQIGGEAAVPLRRARIAILRGLGRATLADRETRTLAADFPGDAAPGMPATGAATRAELDTVLQVRPDDVPALVGRGALNLADGQLEEALADLRGAVRKDPANARALQLLAETHRSMGSTTLAADAWRRLLEVQPMEAGASLALADILLAQQLPEEAERLYRQVLAGAAGNQQAIAGLVDALVARRDWPAAAAVARNAAAATRSAGFGAEETGRVLLARGNFAGARVAFEQALRERPGSDRALEGLVAAMTGGGQEAQSVELLGRHLSQYPDSDTARLLLATRLFARQMPAEAQRLLSTVLANDPRNIHAWLARAEGMPGQRIAILEQALAANPATEPLELRLGAAYEAAGRTDDAARLYEAALARDAHAALPANALARLLLEKDRDAASYQRALELTQRFAASHNPELLHTLGFANYRGGDERAAVRYLEQALAAGLDEPLLRYHLGLAYLATDNRAGARQQFERALKLASDFPGAPEARAALLKLGA
jgi:tetratricopeptide (TPR) repeat protein